MSFQKPTILPNNNRKKQVKRTIMVKSTEDPFNSEADRLSKESFDQRENIPNISEISKVRMINQSKALIPNINKNGVRSGTNQLSLVNRASTALSTVHTGLSMSLRSCKKDGWTTYQEISQLVDATLLKKQKLDQLDSKFCDKLSEAPYFYVKMLTVADRVYEHSAWIILNYNSELYHVRVVTERLFKIIELVEDPQVLKELVSSLKDNRIENALKIRLLNHLVSVGAPIQEGSVKIKLDENIFEMIYHKIEGKLGTENQTSKDLVETLQEMDRMLLGLFRSNYDSSTGERLRAIFEKTGASNPIFKTNKDKTVTYLAKSQVDLKHYGDYLVIVLASFILFDCGEFLSLYLSMERDVEFIVKIVSRIGERSCDLMLKKIDPDYQSHLFEKLGGLLFFKGWASIPDIIRSLQAILNARQLEVGQKVVFYSNSLHCLGTQTKYSEHFEEFLEILLEVGSPELIAGVRNMLKDDPIYVQISEYVRSKLINVGDTGTKPTTPRDLILVSLLIVEETLQLLNGDPEVNWDPNDLDSLPNLLKTSQAMVTQQQFLITGGGEILDLDGNLIEGYKSENTKSDKSDCDQVVQVIDFRKRINNTIIYELEEMGDD